MLLGKRFFMKRRCSGALWTFLVRNKHLSESFGGECHSFQRAVPSQFGGRKGGLEKGLDI